MHPVIYPLAAAQSILETKLKDFPDTYLEFSGDSPNIIRFEIPVENIDPVNWLDSQRSDMKFYFSGRDTEDMETAGIGIADEISVMHSNTKGYSQLFDTIYKRLSPDFPNLKFYGGLSFGLDHIDSLWESFGVARFFIPRFELSKTGNISILACNIKIDKGSPVQLSETIAELLQLNFNESKLHSPGQWISRKDLPERPQWIQNIGDAVNEIQNDRYMKTVLARKVVLDFEELINPSAVLYYLKKYLHSRRYDFLFQFDGKTAFVGSSPERLYKRNGRIIRSEAVAGTRSRGKMDSEDNRLADELMNSDKEQREHDFVVDTIQSTLRDFCSSLHIDSHKGLLKLKEGQHLVSHFEGRLKPDISDAELLEKLHPTPAVGGCPLDKALESIAKYEPFKRGWYAGIIGSIGYSNSDFAVGLRCGVVREKQLSLFSGVGIVDGSNPEDEWQEVEFKIGNFLNILKD